MGVARKINAGMVHVGDQSVNNESNFHFGGAKKSGFGRLDSNFILHEMTTVQLVTI